MTADTDLESRHDLRVTEEGEGPVRRLRIRMPAERVEELRRRERKKLGGSLDIAGFRPGKVPDPVVEERYGEVVDERTIRTAVGEAFREAVEERDLDPVADPEIRDVRYDRGEDLVFEAEVEVMPGLDLERTGGFRLRRPEVEVSPEDVDEILSRIREDRGLWKPAERAPRDGDQVAVRIRALEPGEEPGNAGEEADERPEPYRFELGQGYAIPDVEKAIRSLDPGEAGVFEVDFPDDFDSEELAGRTRRLHVELLSVKEKELPELDDDFASGVGDFDSLEGLRDAIREDLTGHREEEAEEAVRRELLDSIVEANPFDVPPAMVERYLDRVMDVPPDADPEEVRQARESLHARAEQEIKRQLVLDRLVEVGGYGATDEELEDRIEEIAENRGSAPGEVRRELAREGRLQAIREHLAAEKMFEDLKAESEIT